MALTFKARTNVLKLEKNYSNFVVFNRNSGTKKERKALNTFAKYLKKC